MKVKILGISGSPRHANTEFIVKEALASAEELPDVETEYYSLAGKKLNGCIMCAKCHDPEATQDNPCPPFPDDVVALSKKMVKSDGMIIGTPVYVGAASAQLKMVFDRISSFIEHGPFGHQALRNKVVGAVTSAWDREGGHCMAIMDIIKYSILMDMIVVGSGPERLKTVCYWGGAVIESYHADKPEPFWEGVGTPEEKRAVKYDKLGLGSVRRVGKRVAEMAKVVKAGFEVLPREQTYWPHGPLAPDFYKEAHFRWAKTEKP